MPLQLLQFKNKKGVTKLTEGKKKTYGVFLEMMLFEVQFVSYGMLNDSNILIIGNKIKLRL